MRNSEMKFEWEPLKRIGCFELGAPVQSYIERCRLTLVTYDDDPTGWDTYEMPDMDMALHVEEGEIVSVACEEECWYKGVNLIGFDFDEAKKLLGLEPSDDVDIIEIDDEPQEVYEFDDVEAQIWVKDGKIVTVICRPLLVE
jgi:hypothetical protein